MTLISAKTLREQAEANKKADEERKYNETVELADKVAKRVREMIEERIESEAAKGKMSTGRMRPGYSATYGGMVLDAIAEITGDGRGDFGLESAIRIGNIGNQTSRARAYVHDRWVSEVEAFIAELDENGFEVEVEGGSPYQPYPSNLEATPKDIADGYVTISW